MSLLSEAKTSKSEYHLSTQEEKKWKFNGKSLFAYNQVFNNDEIVTEITETEAVTHLTAVQVVEVKSLTVQ